jgi:hypothetical protein
VVVVWAFWRGRTRVGARAPLRRSDRVRVGKGVDGEEAKRRDRGGGDGEWWRRESSESMRLRTGGIAPVVFYLSVPSVWIVCAIV